MKRFSEFYLKTALVLQAIALLASSLYVMGAPPLGIHEVEPVGYPPLWWMWIFLAGLLLPWIPLLLLKWEPETLTDTTEAGDLA